MNERSLSARWRNVGVVSVVCAAASPRAPPLDEPPLSSERPLDHGSWRLFLLLATLHREKRTGSSGPAAEPGDSLPLEGHGGRLGESLSDTADSLKKPRRITVPADTIQVIRAALQPQLVNVTIAGGPLILHVATRKMRRSMARYSASSSHLYKRENKCAARRQAGLHLRSAQRCAAVNHREETHL